MEIIPLLEDILKTGNRIKQALGDGIYDTRKNFKFLSDHGIVPGIPPRKNASTRSRGVSLRSREVWFIKNYGRALWKKTRGYSKRVSVERAFGGFKQVFGDYVQSRKWDTIIRELEVKFALYGVMLVGINA